MKELSLLRALDTSADDESRLLRRLFGLALVTALGLVLYAAYAAHVVWRLHRAERAVAELRVELDARGRSLDTREAELGALNEAIDARRLRLSELDAMEAQLDRFARARRQRSVEVLGESLAVAPRGVSLERAEQEAGTLTLRGRARSEAAVADYLLALEALAPITGVRLDSLQERAGSAPGDGRDGKRRRDGDYVFGITCRTL